ncbi:hypothetical protein MG293_002586 [Ovis ammon polii]|uniref:DH domain-containing protein n=1 Tax=Ovis ammon polii TaxID=230172 RepID=A0AAD4UIS0_OVIAM|nr:hypothetical protein MG293_002586 [Ovis ammon polii]
MQEMQETQTSVTFLTGPNRACKRPKRQRKNNFPMFPSPKCFSQTLQRSISFRSESRPELLGPRPWSRNAAPLSTKRRDSKLWSETFDVCVNQMLMSKEIKGQEAIFELSQGEDLIEDLKLAKKAYHDPMLKLSIMTEQELNQIFETLDSLIPLHEDLLSQLRNVRKPDGSTEHVGPILVGWPPCLSSYDSYCSNQVAAKALLDHKKQDHPVQDFLQRSINITQGTVAEINTKSGESECRYYKEQLLYLEEGQKDSLIDNSEVLCCHGELKNNWGVKLHLCYQLYWQPIPMNDLLEDLQDGEGGWAAPSMGLSFKNGYQSQTHSLQANDTFNKQQRLNCIRQAKQFCGPFLDPATGSREPWGETKLEQMDQSESESDCSMDMNEVSLDCEHMEQTESSCGNSRHVESNI